MIRASKLLLIFAVLASAAPLDLSAWKYRKPIPLSAGANLVVSKLDRDIYTGSLTALADLLVIHDGKDVPFVLVPPAAAEEPVPSEERMLNESLVPGVGLQFEIHLTKPGEHNSILLHTDEKNFRNRVRVETSQDGVEWAYARGYGAIFNFSQDGREFGSTIVEYPVSTRPFLRVTILNWSKMGSFTVAMAEHKPTPPVAYETFATLTPSVTEDPATKSTLVTVDQGVSGLPVSRLVLEILTPRFQRPVLIETSGDGKNWQYLAEHVIALIREGQFTEEALVLQVPGAQRFIRLRVYNRDDRPLQFGRIMVEGRVSEIKFFAPEQGPYWLYYGNPAASQPREYDLGAIVANKSFREVKTPFGSPEANPAYHAPAAPQKPWSEQHPAILYTVLGAAVLALGIATFRFAARLRPTS